MTGRKLKVALAAIAADADPTRKAAKLASLCCALFRKCGVELVVVGGSAIEMLTTPEGSQPSCAPKGVPYLA